MNATGYRPYLYSLTRHTFVNTLHAACVGLLAGSALLAFSGCSKKQDAAPAAAAAPVAEVGVVTVKPVPLTLTRDLPGRTAAYRVAEVRARVDGIVEKRLFEEGAQVEQGQMLYQIDPAPYEATLESARASLARAEANLVAAEAQVGRYKELVERKAVSRQQYDDSVALVGSGRADVAAAKAAVRSAEIDLGYTKVAAPVSGIIGRSDVTEGAYVQRGAATLLATIRQLDPIYVDVTQSVDQYLRLKRDLAEGNLQKTGEDEVKVTLLLDDENYPHEGKLQFAEVSVDESTNSVTLRALFPNPEKFLLPGMYVRARVPEAQQPTAILVPQRGVTRSNSGEAIAMVVNEEGIVEVRPLKTDRTVGNSWLVADGLNPGDKLIVDGLQKVRPGMQTKAVDASAATAAATAR